MFKNPQAGIGFTFDAYNVDAQAAMGFIVSQTSYIEPLVYEQPYPDIQYPALIPVDTSAPPWIKTITFYSGDKFGVAQWINANADDLPLAGAELSKFESAVYSAGIAYGFGYEEIRQAQMLGMNLDATNAMAARRAYEEFVDNAALNGDARKNMSGIINFPTITPTAAPYGDWDASSFNVDHALADINYGIIGIGTDTLWQMLGNTVLMSDERLALLASLRIPNTSETIFSYIMRNNAYTARTGQPLTIRSVRGLSTAGVGGTQRLVVYRRDPTVLKMHIPLPLLFLPPYQAAPLRWEIPGIFRLGGLDIRQPKLVRYLDGI